MTSDDTRSGYQAAEIRRRVAREAGFRYDVPDQVLTDWLIDRGREEDAALLRRYPPDRCGEDLPWRGVCKLGPHRYYWVLWASLSDADIDPDADGYALTREQAEADMAAAAVCRGIALRSLHGGKTGIAGVASEWHRVVVARRRQSAQAGDTDTAREQAEADLGYVYRHDSWVDDYSSSMERATYRHRVLRRTARRLYVARVAEDAPGAGAREWGGVHLVDQIVLDRARLEAGEEIYHPRFRYGGVFSLSPSHP
jgi:hypothetical protein